MPKRTQTAILAAALLLAALTTAATRPAPAAARTDCETTLWTAGTGGYASYRIPAVIADGGTLLAFAEARKNSDSDTGDIEVVERRSTDGGCTWSPSVRISDSWYDTVGNPTPVLAADGTLVLLTMWNRGSVTSAEIHAGTVAPADGRRVFVQTSADAGATWSSRREITSSVKQADWLWYATGPGHGLTLTHGAAASRLVVAADHSELGPGRGAQLLLSDDNGATWRIGATDDHTDGVITPDETSAAQLPDGRIYLSSRNEGTGPGRAYTYSLNAGRTFSAPFRPKPELVTTNVEGSVLQDPGLPAGVSCHPLLYSGPQDPAVRQDMAIRRSDDGGLTWRTVTELDTATTPAAYSDIAKTDRTHLGLAYETGTEGPYEQIAWRSIPLTCP